LGEYLVEPKSRKELRRLARIFRKVLRLDDCLYFPIVQVLEALPEFFHNFSCEIVEEDELSPGIHADTDILAKHIRIRQRVYDRACEGEGRDRMTIAHEIGHYLLLCVFGFKLERNFKNEGIPPCRDPEWQAKCFAGELIGSAHLVKGMSEEEISNKCGVSLDAARLQHKHL